MKGTGSAFDKEARKVVPVFFYRSAAGAEPVREWLRGLSKEDKRIVGKDIATVEFGWPVGMPTCRSMKSRPGLWEIRSSLTGKRIARILFFIHTGQLILLHSFIKKAQRTPNADLDLAVKRKKEFQNAAKAK